MKHFLRLTLAFVALAFGGGCQTTIAPGADPVIVRAEQTAEIALATFDAFLKWERRNQSVVGADVRAVAKEIRLRGKQWILDLRAATRAYAASRTGDNLDKLRFAQQVIELAIKQINQIKP